MITTIGMQAVGRQIEFDLDLDESVKHHATLLQHYNEHRVYEEEIVWLMMRSLHIGDTAIDVGANSGIFTLAMSRLVGPSGQVLAFEPNPSAAGYLRRHLRLNNMSNVALYEHPLWKTEGTIEFHLNSDDSAGSSLWPPGLWWENEKSRSEPKSLKMDAHTLDSVVETPVKFIKIDAEGADQAVLEGAHDTLEKHRPPYVVVELNPFGMQQLGYNTQDFRAFMSMFDYDLFFLNRNDALPTFVPFEVKVEYAHKVQVKNALFSTKEAVAKAWPSAVS